MKIFKFPINPMPDPRKPFVLHTPPGWFYPISVQTQKNEWGHEQMVLWAETSYAKDFDPQDGEKVLRHIYIVPTGADFFDHHELVGIRTFVATVQFRDTPMPLVFHVYFDESTADVR